MSAVKPEPQMRKNPPRNRPDSGSSTTPSAGASTGLLVNVIRTLTTSVSMDQRELEKQRLEIGYRESGRVIDGLVAAHQEDLTTSLQSFRKVSSRIIAARERVCNVRNSLQTCKALLHCRREDLKKLWLESAEQKYVSQMLEQVEHVRSIGGRVQEAAANRQYLTAADKLLDAMVSVEGDLKGIDGLSDLKSGLRRTNEALFAKMMDEINNLVYIRPCEEQMYEVFKTVSGGPVGHSAMVAAVLSKSVLAEGACLKASDDDTVRLAENACAMQESVEELDRNPAHLLAVLVEALAVLRRLPEAIEKLKHGIQRGLNRAVQLTVAYYHERQTIALGPSVDQGGAAVGDAHHLSELLHLLFRQFKVTGVLQSLLLTQLRRVCDTRHLSGVDLFAIDDYWTQVQVAMQQLLNDYLDVSGVGATAATSARLNQTVAASLSSYFAKRPTARVQKPALFRFDAAAHAMHHGSSNNPRSNQRDIAFHLSGNNTGANAVNEASGTHVCPPAAANVTAVFRGLSKFAAEIELKLKLNAPCQLRVFLENFVRDTFLPRVQNELREKADAALQAGDSWHTVISTEEQRLRNSPEVLISSARTLELCVYVSDLMQALPPFADRLAALWLLILAEYSRCTLTVYEQATRSIRQPDGMEPTEWRKISAAWAVDEDISRLLKSLPNWLTLVIEPLQALQTPSLFSPPTAPATPMVESADEIRRRNQRESEILIGNLGMQKKIEDWEVITDVPHIRSLSNMHESLEWFCASVRRTLAQLPSSAQERLRQAQVEVSTSDSDRPPEIETLSVGLEKRLNALDEMAGTCLLMLHLEVRVHCFYHLLPLARQGSHVIGASQSQEADPRILALNRDLVQLHELLGAQLQPRKVRYVFEGLGHLVSVIFIHSSQHIQKINDNGKKRMCRNIFSLQQCLSALTSNREPDLDTARKFFEMLYSSPDEIIDGIVGRGPKFTEIEYTFLLSLAVRSHAVLSSEPGALESRLSRLREVMSERRK